MTRYPPPSAAERRVAVAPRGKDPKVSPAGDTSSANASSTPSSSACATPCALTARITNVLFSPATPKIASSSTYDDAAAVSARVASTTKGDPDAGSDPRKTSSRNSPVAGATYDAAYVPSPASTTVAHTSGVPRSADASNRAETTSPPTPREFPNASLASTTNDAVAPATAVASPAPVTVEFAASVRSAANVTPANAPTTAPRSVTSSAYAPAVYAVTSTPNSPRAAFATTHVADALTVPTNVNSGVSVTPQSPSASPLDTAFPFASLACSVATDATPATPPKSAAPRANDADAFGAPCVTTILDGDPAIAVPSRRTATEYVPTVLGVSWTS